MSARARPDTPAEASKSGSPRTVVRLIRQLQQGQVAGASLSPDDRRRVVEHLTAEGYSSVEIAEIAGVSERTVERDRAAIRASHALELTPAFAAETIGHLLRQAEAASGRLRRMARDKAAPAAARVDAEYAAWRVQRELIAALQRLGCLPDVGVGVGVGVAVGVHADVVHRFDGSVDPVAAAPELEVLAAELARLEGIHARTGGVPEVVLARIGEHRDAIARLALGARLEAMRDGPDKPEARSPSQDADA